MPFDPTDHRTWTTLGDHPIFGDTKSQIAKWSLDSSRYCEPSSYGRFMPEWYVHIDPPLPVDEQLRNANRDTANLASACSRIEQAFGHIRYELVVLDDFTLYVWIQHPQFSIDIYPNHFSDENAIVQVFIDTSSVEISECFCETVEDLISTLRQAIGT